jgi:hypothetical protein
MMAQSLCIATFLAIYVTTDWLLSAGTEFILHLLGVA